MPRPWTRMTNPVVRTMTRRALTALQPAAGLFPGWPSLREEVLRREAEQFTGLRGWADEDFREPLERLIGFAESEADLSLIGRYRLKLFLLRRLCNRQLIEERLRRHPEILEATIDRHLFLAVMEKNEC